MSKWLQYKHEPDRNETNSQRAPFFEGFLAERMTETIF